MSFAQPPRVSTAVLPVPQPGSKYAIENPPPRSLTAPVRTFTTAARPSTPCCWAMLSACSGAYTTTASTPPAVTHACPIHKSVCTAGSPSVATVCHA